jgi:hypothetical protein
MLNGEALQVHFPNVAGEAVKQLIGKFEAQNKVHPAWAKPQAVAV